MEYINMRKMKRDELKPIRSQVVRLKKMGKTGKEIEEITGVRQNRISEIWTAYQRDGEKSLSAGRGGRKPGDGRLLAPEEEKSIRAIIVEDTPEQYGIPGQLWTLEKASQLVRKKCGKVVTPRSMSDYMKRWGLSCQRPAKRARKQEPSRV